MRPDPTPMPVIGTRVRLTLRNDYSASVFKHLFYRVMGRVMPLPTYGYPHGTFCILVSDDYVPVRVIRMSNVHSANGERVHGWRKAADVVPAPPPPMTRSFEVTGSKGDKYVVDVTAGVASCTCTGFAYRRTCRHAAETLNGPTGRASARVHL